MNDKDLEHPDITAAQRTGYPQRVRAKVAAFCSDCGAPIFPGERFLRIRGWGCLCQDCVENNWEAIYE